MTKSRYKYCFLSIIKPVQTRGDDEMSDIMPVEITQEARDYILSKSGSVTVDMRLRHT